MGDIVTLANTAIAAARKVSELKQKLGIAEATLAAEISGKVRLHEQVEELESAILWAFANSTADEKVANILARYAETGEGPNEPEETPRKPEFVLAKGYDSEWVAGPFDSEEEARAEIRLYDEDDKLRVHHVKYMSVGDWLPTVSDLLETMDMTAHDNGYSIDDPTHVIVSEPAAQRALERWAERWIYLENEKWVGDEVK